MKKVLLSNNIREYCLFTLKINSGLQISDLLHLNSNDVINEKGKIRDRITLREKNKQDKKSIQVY